MLVSVGLYIDNAAILLEECVSVLRRTIALTYRSNWVTYKLVLDYMPPTLGVNKYLSDLQASGD